MKAKTLDRLALTRQKFGHIMKQTGSHAEVKASPASCQETDERHRQGYSTCPMCGSESLVHEDGCKRCYSCGWSACG